MSVHQTAQLVYVHFPDRFGIHLFELHVKRVLPGYPIPSQYTVHASELDLTRRSINLAMTNGGGPVDIEALTVHINTLKIFGTVEAGVFGIQEIRTDPLAA